MIKIRRIFDLKSYFVEGHAAISTIDVSFGLNQLSGFNAIFKRLGEF